MKPFYTLALLLFGAAPLSTFALSDALKIKISGNGSSDETVVRFLEGATSQFDGKYDAWKWLSPNAKVPSVYTCLDSASLLSVNSLPPLNGYIGTPIYVKIPVAASYTISAVEAGAFSESTIILVEDLISHKVYNIRQNPSYSVSLPVSGGEMLLKVHFFVSPRFSATDISCNGLSDGSITAELPGVTAWTLALLSAKGDTLRLQSVSGTSITVTGLSSSAYQVVAYTPVYMAAYSLVINEPPALQAAFRIANSTTTPGTPVLFENQSVNAVSFEWKFGDGSSSGQISPTHVYQADGNYKVTLTAFAGQCTSSVEHGINISSGTTTGIKEWMESNTRIAAQSGGLLIDIEHKQVMQYIILNSLGQMVHQGKLNGSLTVPLNTTGIYTVILSGNNLTYSQKVAYSGL